MEHEQTTIAVQRILNDLTLGSQNGLGVRELLGRAANRLHMLCTAMLYRGYPRLAQPPLGLHSEELLGSVVARLMTALQRVKPPTVRQFFALANQHMRWELNDLARRLDSQQRTCPIREDLTAAPPPSEAAFSPVALKILHAIEALPRDEQEVFDLVRIHGLSHPETADILEISVKTVQRRLNRSLVLLGQSLGDLDLSESENV